MPRPIAAHIHIDAMRSNLSVAKACAPHSKIWAVVKANAYGHGLEHAVCGFDAADGFALVEPDAAVRLRAAGVRKPILLLEGFFDDADLATVIEHGLQTVVHCDEQIAMLESARPKSPLTVHLKMNSGMNRLGFRPEAFGQAYARLRTLAFVHEIHLMTHFANAEDDANGVLPLSLQMRRFRETVQGLPGAWSLSNSAANLMHPEIRADWSRPGIMLYGGTPGGKTALECGLQPAMTLKSRIIGVQNVLAGEAVGYGSRFVAERAMRIGVVACGYADGYPRHAPSGTPILVDGIRTRIIGRVSMDMLTVDLTPAPMAGIGSAVTLWGQGLPVDEVAQAAGTIGYELMCALTPRVPLQAHEGGAALS